MATDGLLQALRVFTDEQRALPHRTPNCLGL